jgi:hypothetical protein
MKEIFSHETWTIWEPEDTYWNMDYDVVTHQCGWWDKRKVHHAWDMMNLTHCKHCGDEIPEEVIGVWKLKNMGCIQRDAGEDTFYASAFWGAPKHI